MDGLLEVAITSHYLTFMKSRSKKSLRLNATQIEDATKWIDKLPKKEVEKLEQITRVIVAQALMKEFLRNAKSREKRSGK